MRRLFGRNQKGQLHVVEAIIVGILVFTILFVTSVFRLPTSPSTFQQAELAGLSHDTLVAMLAKPPNAGADCNETPCPFDSELERMISLAFGYEGATRTGVEVADVTPVSDYLTQALPPGTRYILNVSNGVLGRTVYPPNIVPPALDISVGHILMSPRWDQYASQVDQSMIIRINEPTGFKTAEIASILDPLNRDNDEETPANLHTALFANALGTKAVPEDAVYGTYRVCRASGPCTYFTVVPPGIFGAGSSILTNDRDNTTTLSSKGAFDLVAKYADNSTTGTPGSFDSADWMYLDLTGAGVISTGDLRLTAKTFCRGTVTCAAGTYVEENDADRVSLKPLVALPADRVRAAMTGSDAAALEEGEAIYFDSDGSNTISVNDRRLSRVGTYSFGSVVAAADYDLASPALSAFTAEEILWGDLDAGGDIDVGEPVYLDFAGHGQAAGLGALDIHLSPKGNPTARYIYDVKLVVWYGI